MKYKIEVKNFNILFESKTYDTSFEDLDLLKVIKYFNLNKVKDYLTEVGYNILTMKSFKDNDTITTMFEIGVQKINCDYIYETIKRFYKKRELTDLKAKKGVTLKESIITEEGLITKEEKGDIILLQSARIQFLSFLKENKDIERKLNFFKEYFNLKNLYIKKDLLKNNEIYKLIVEKEGEISNELLNRLIIYIEN